jgi:hypothetical protein
MQSTTLIYHENFLPKSPSVLFTKSSKWIKMNYLSLSFFLLISAATFAQSPSTTWPFPNLNRPNCSSMPPAATTCTKWAVQNGRWDDGSTWNGGTVPRHKDIVCIPSGRTVTVKNPTYTATSSCPNTDSVASPQCFIFICGTIDFDASGKLHLGCNSSIQVLPGGKVLPANGNSDLIQIGTTVVWRDNNTTLTGPTCVCNGCPPNNVGCSYSAPLPAQLLSFTAKQKNQNQIELSWSAMLTNDVKKFTVEKSYDGNNWLQVGDVQANGNIHSVSYYRYADNQPASGLNYYRLKQVDQDGHFEYSKIAELNVKNYQSVFSVFPNPAVDKITLFASEGFGQGYYAQLYQKNGALLKTQILMTGNSQLMNVADLPNGVYFIRIVDENGGTRFTQSLLKN